jgi:hypothetical protein
MRQFLAMALLCMVASCSASPVFARSHHHRQAISGESVHRRASAHRHSHHRAQRPVVAIHESFGWGGGLVERARSYIGRTGPSLGLPARLWCSDFANMVTGGGTGSRLARSWLSRPHVSPQVGAMVVTGRRGGGHVGIVSGFTAAGDPIVISGNHGRVVGEGVYARGRILAYVSP